MSAIANATIRPFASPLSRSFHKITKQQPRTFTQIEKSTKPNHIFQGTNFSSSTPYQKMKVKSFEVISGLIGGSVVLYTLNNAMYSEGSPEKQSVTIYSPHLMIFKPSSEDQPNKK